MIAHLQCALGDALASNLCQGTETEADGGSREPGGAREEKRDGGRAGIRGGAVLVDPHSNEVLVCSSSVRWEWKRRRTHLGSDSSSLSSAATTRPADPHPLHTPIMLCIQGLAWIHEAHDAEESGRGHMRMGEIYGSPQSPLTLGSTESLKGRLKRYADGPGPGPPGESNDMSSCYDDRIHADASLRPLKRPRPGPVAQSAAAESKVAARAARSARSIQEGKSYLCTGLDLYCTHEPGPMCAMALVHSRIRQVVYAVPSPQNGALGSVESVHEIRSLNHHFRVFRPKLMPRAPLPESPSIGADAGGAIASAAPGGSAGSMLVQTVNQCARL